MDLIGQNIAVVCAEHHPNEAPKQEALPVRAISCRRGDKSPEFASRTYQHRVFLENTGNVQTRFD